MCVFWTEMKCVCFNFVTLGLQSTKLIIFLLQPTAISNNFSTQNSYCWKHCDPKIAEKALPVLWIWSLKHRRAYFRPTTWTFGQQKYLNIVATTMDMNSMPHSNVRLLRSTRELPTMHHLACLALPTRQHPSSYFEHILVRIWSEINW